MTAAMPSSAEMPLPTSSAAVTSRLDEMPQNTHRTISAERRSVSPPQISDVTSRGNIIVPPSGFGPMLPLAADFEISSLVVPHRDWAYANLLIRGEISVIASPGGIGKTTYSLTVASALACGRALLKGKIWDGASVVLYINAEDSRTEILRRLWAVTIFHGLGLSDLCNLKVLGADNYQTQALSLMRIEKGASVLDRAGLAALDGMLDQIRPTVLVLDPLIALCGGGNINDNAIMALVMRALKTLAARFNCAILVLHHTRKGGDLSSAEAIGGASAIVNLARTALQLIPMTAEEANANGVLPSERAGFFRVVSTKANLVPATSNTDWYRLCSVSLPNAAPPRFPNGDNVQAVESVTLPLVSSVRGASDQIIRDAILKIVDAGKLINGKRYSYSPNITGAVNQRSLLDDAMAVANGVTAGAFQHDDLRSMVKRAIGSLKRDQSLIEEVIPEGRFRRRTGIKTRAGKILCGSEDRPSEIQTFLPTSRNEDGSPHAQMGSLGQSEGQ